MKLPQIGTQAGYYNKVPYTTAVGTNALLVNNYYTNNDPGKVQKIRQWVGRACYLQMLWEQKIPLWDIMHSILMVEVIGYFLQTAIRLLAIVQLHANRGNDNTSVGYLALSKNIGGSDHVAVGSRALANTTANYPNTAGGYFKPG